MTFFNYLINLFRKKEINYPEDFALIRMSNPSLNQGIKNNRNKIILRYSINKYGNRELRKYPYSEIRVKTLQEIYRIPIADLTRKETKFPIFSRSLPGEVSYLNW